MSWNTDTGVFGGAIGNYSLQVKYIFLAFLQGFFADHPRYTWVLGNPALSDILILDKYSYNIKTAGKKPAIILSRGPMRWLNTSIGQRDTVDIISGAESYNDLLEGSISLNCISKEGMEAEELASIVFNIITAYKNKLCGAGLHKIGHISISEEQAIKIDAEPNVSAITVSVQYTKQATVRVAPKFYNMSVIKTATFVEPVVAGDTDDAFEMANLGRYIIPAGANSTTLVEDLNYSIVSGGSYISFNVAPESSLTIISGAQAVGGTSDGSTPNPAGGSLIEGQPSYALTYLSAVSLATVTQTISGNSVATDYPLTESVYGYGPLVQELLFTYSGVSTDGTTYVETGTTTAPGQTGANWFKVSGYEA